MPREISTALSGGRSSCFCSSSTISWDKMISPPAGLVSCSLRGFPSVLVASFFPAPAYRLSKIGEGIGRTRPDPIIWFRYREAL